MIHVMPPLECGGEGLQMERGLMVWLLRYTVYLTTACTKIFNKCLYTRSKSKIGNDSFIYDFCNLKFMNRSLNRKGRGRGYARDDTDYLMANVIASTNELRSHVNNTDHNLRQEARLIVKNNENKPAHLLGNKFLKDISRFSMMVATINKNTRLARDYNFGSIVICDLLDAKKINNMIDSLNEYTQANPQTSLVLNKKTGQWYEAKPLAHVDFTGVVMV